MYHTLSCTAISLFLSLILGFCIRLYYEKFLFGGNGFAQSPTIIGAEFVAQLFVFMALTILAIVIWVKGRRNPLTDYKQMLLTIVRDIKEEDVTKWKNLFSQFFPDKKPQKAD